MPDEQNMPSSEDQIPPTDTAQPQTETQTPTDQPISTPQAAGKSNKKKLGLVVLIIIALLVLIGGSAGAYYGVIVPNKPENVLKKAIINSLEQPQMTATGDLTIDLKKTEGDEPNNVKVKLKVQVDRSKHALNEEVEATVAGIKLPLEIRYVATTMYIKLGDLSTIKGLVGLAARAGGDAEAITAMIDALTAKLSNQWIEIDSTLLKQAKADCVLDVITGPFTKEDVDAFMKAYTDNKVVTIKNSSKDTVNGRAATRYDLAVDMSKFNADSFNSQLEGSPFVKKINDCTKDLPGASAEAQMKSAKDLQDKISKLNASYVVWVDKATKKINQFEIKASNDDFNAVFKGQYTDEKVDIKKPDGAKPIMQILSELGSLFYSSPLAQTLGVSANRDVDGVSDKCLQALEDYANSGGTKPVPANCM